MRPLFFLALFLIATGTDVFSQGFKGYNTSKRAGFYALAIQPTRILDMEKRWNINVLGVNANLVGGLEEASASAASDAVFGRNIFQLSRLENASAGFYANLVLPGLVYKPTDRLAVGFAPSFRSIGLGRYTRPKVLTFVENLANGDTDEPISFGGSSEFAFILMHNWISFAFPVSYEIYNDKKHRIQIGGSLKLISGSSSGSVELRELQVRQLGGDTIILDGGLSFIYNDGLSQFLEGEPLKFDLFRNFGLGIDLGARYSYFRDPEDAENGDYLFDVGVALTDLGQVRYTPSNNSTEFDFDDRTIVWKVLGTISGIDQIVDSLQAFEQSIPQAENYTISLPTRFGFQADVKVYKDFYFNVQGSTVLSNYEELDAFNSFYSITLTPRFENQKFGFYLPVNIRRGIRNTAGFAFSYKTYFIGSANIFSSLADNSDASYLNFYMGASFGIK